MDAVEFLRDFRRMCSSYGYVNCDECNLACTPCNVKDCNCDHEKVIQVVEKWVKAHPVKTRLSEFLKLFPNVPTQEEDYPYACIKIYDSTVKCKDSEGCLDCRKKFWFTPIEEDRDA